MTEDEMVRWHHRLDGHEFEQTHKILKDGEAWHATVHGAAEVDTAEQLSNNNRRLKSQALICFQPGWEPQGSIFSFKLHVLRRGNFYIIV